MITNLKKIEQIARQIHKYLPQGICKFSDNIEKTINQYLQKYLTHLGLVNREEFDIQIQVLLNTHEKLASLSQRLYELENKHKHMKSISK